MTSGEGCRRLRGPALVVGFQAGMPPVYPTEDQLLAILRAPDLADVEPRRSSRFPVCGGLHGGISRLRSPMTVP